MIIAHYLSQAHYTKTLLTVGDAPRREPPNDPKKPPVKSPPRKRKSPVKEPPEPSDIQDPSPRRKSPMGDPPRPGSETLLHFHPTIRTAKKFTGTKSLGTFVAVRISHDKKQTGRKENGKVSL
jgi:hypothetical protein